MNSILTAILVVSCLGALASIILVIASKLLFVPTDERADTIAALLPGANCGACGFAGCSNYAAAVAKGEAEPNRCTVGGAVTASEIGKVMGVDAVFGEVKKAFVACRGTQDKTKRKFDYSGIQSCAAANMLHAGAGSCAFGCMGLGDCAAACKFGAITVENGVAGVDEKKCTGCGACVLACPKGIITMVDKSASAAVACKNTSVGPATHKVCLAGCIGCKKCVAECPVGAISIEGGLDLLRQDLCVGCKKCATLCPVHAIITL
ncbi:MAG: RnfABCDGE type electron transport complex subunit B [Oscillospiraceae bacterium]